MFSSSGLKIDSLTLTGQSRPRPRVCRSQMLGDPSRAGPDVWVSLLTCGYVLYWSGCWMTYGDAPSHDDEY
eukprot:1027478-Rhodomonas_salina.1